MSVDILERIWNEAATSYSRHYPYIYLEGLRKIIKTLRIAGMAEPVYCENHVEHIYTFCGQNAEILDAKAGCRSSCSYRCALKGSGVNVRLCRSQQCFCFYSLNFIEALSLEDCSIVVSQERKLDFKSFCYTSAHFTSTMCVGPTSSLAMCKGSTTLLNIMCTYTA